MDTTQTNTKTINYVAAAPAAVTQTAVTRELGVQRQWIHGLATARLNHDIETREDRAKTLRGAREYHAAWKAKVAAWGFAL